VNDGDDDDNDNKNKVPFLDVSTGLFPPL